MRIKIYDGAESIGGTKIYAEENNEGVFLDFGVNFEKMNLYFKHYLRRRAVRGIYDAIILDILPKIRIYRSDLIPHDLSISNFERINPKGVLVSHAHLDHFGEIGNIRFDVHIGGSPLTLLLIKAMQDCNHSSLIGDAIYSSLRKPKDDPRILNAKNRSVGVRHLLLTEQPDEKIIQFLCTIPSPTKKDEYEENFKIGDIGTLPFEISAHPVDHSIYGACGYKLQGDTTIAYTGDIRLHGESGNDTEEFAKRARDASVLIIEGTRLSRETHDYITEKDVKEKIRKEIDGAHALVIVDFSSRNFERLKELLEISPREVVITEKDAYMLYALQQAGIDLLSKNTRVYRALRGKKEKWIDYLVDMINIDEIYVTPEEIRNNPENFVLAFSLTDMPNLLDIRPKGGTYIYSSTEALNEEQELDFVTLYNWLTKFNFQIRGFFRKGGELVFEKGYHASGHASPEDIRKIIEIVDPDKIIPVHTLNPQWFKQEFGKAAEIIKNGQEISF
ncbi:MAG: hypothetical protein J7L63_00325 [Thermoplasmata archaeon]|nr:hypothetical protein [Thermoplasmata archaeon]